MKERHRLVSRDQSAVRAQRSLPAALSDSHRAVCTQQFSCTVCGICFTGAKPCGLCTEPRVQFRIFTLTFKECMIAQSSSHSICVCIWVDVVISDRPAYSVCYCEVRDQRKHLQPVDILHWGLLQCSGFFGLREHPRKHLSFQLLSLVCLHLVRRSFYDVFISTTTEEKPHMLLPTL